MRLRPRHSNESKLSRSLIALPRLVASGAMSVRIQSASAEAMAQRRIAAGFTDTCRLSGSTIASSRTRSSPPQPPTPWMSGMLGAMAMASVSASRQAEGCGEAAVKAAARGCSAGLPAWAGASAARLAGLSLAGFGCRAHRPGEASAAAPPRGARVPREPRRRVPEQVAPQRRPAALGRQGRSPDSAPRSATAATVTIAAAMRPKAP